MSLMAIIRGQWEHMEDDEWQLCVSPRITKMVDYQSSYWPNGRVKVFTHHDPTYYLNTAYNDIPETGISLHRLETLQDEDCYEYDFFLLVPKASFDFKSRYQRRLWIPIPELEPVNQLEEELKRRLGLFTAPTRLTFHPTGNLREYSTGYQRDF